MRKFRFRILLALATIAIIQLPYLQLGHIFSLSSIHRVNIDSVPLYRFVLEAFASDDGKLVVDKIRSHKNCFPKFMVIGAQKSGTSTMNAFLKLMTASSKSHKKAHALRMPHRMKELNLLSERLAYWFVWRSWNNDLTFESENDVGVWWIPKGTSNIADLINWYAEEFETRPLKHKYNYSCGNQIRGEISPNYMSHPIAPLLAKLLFPDLKLVVMLRDPVARTLSAFNMKWQARTCLSGAAWKSPNCYDELIRKNISTKYELAKNWINALSVSVDYELDAVQKCEKRSHKLDPGFSINDYLESRYSCCYPQPSFKLKSLDNVSAYSLYEELEDRSFVRRSLYACQLQLWNRFFIINEHIFRIPLNILIFNYLGKSIYIHWCI